MQSEVSVCLLVCGPWCEGGMSLACPSPSPNLPCFFPPQVQFPVLQTLPSWDLDWKKTLYLHTFCKSGCRSGGIQNKQWRGIASSSATLKCSLHPGSSSNTWWLFRNADSGFTPILLNQKLCLDKWSLRSFAFNNRIPVKVDLPQKEPFHLLVFFQSNWSLGMGGCW